MVTNQIFKKEKNIRLFVEKWIKEYEEYQEFQDYEEFLKLENWWIEITGKAILELQEKHKEKYKRFIELKEKTKPIDT